MAHDAGVFNHSVIENDYIFSKYASSLIDKTTSLLNEKRQCSSVVSFIVPVFNTPLLYLQQLISSLEIQTYPHWELCLGVGSLDPEVLSFLKYKMQRENRIKYIEVDSSDQGISVNSNAALSISTGAYIALLDHDDFLPASCAREIIFTHEQNDCDFVYTAEDKVDTTGLNYFDPVYKYAYSEEKLLNNNYITHLSSFSRDLIEAVGGFRPEYDGAQDFDLILRASSRAKRICYIPRVLYHWRVFEGSTSDGSSHSKPYALEAGKKAIESYLSEKGLENYEVKDGDMPFTYCVKFDD